MVVNWDWVDDHDHNPHLYLLPQAICITTPSLFQHDGVDYILTRKPPTSTEFQRPSMTMVYPNMRMYPPTISQASENIASELPSKSKSLSYKNKFIINTHLKDHSTHQHIIIKL